MEQFKFIANKEQLKLFFYTMYERQQIWYKRFILNLPKEQWTTDKLYSKYRFTNVYRELDRASQYLIKNIILNRDCWCKFSNDEDNYINLIWKILFFRIINNPRIYTNVNVIADYNKYNADTFYDYLKENVIGKNINFGHGAYLQFSQREIEDENGTKLVFENICEYFAKFILVKLHSHIKDIYKLMKDSFTTNKSAYELINFMSSTINGCGPFMAHEFYQDLCYIKQYTGLVLMNYDANSATNAGPGSSGGAKYIFSNITTKSDVVEIIKYLRDISEESLKEIQQEQFKDSDGFYYIEWDSENSQYKHTAFNFSLNQIEMWLCEYYKYVKYNDLNVKNKVRIYNYKNTTDDLLY